MGTLPYTELLCADHSLTTSSKNNRTRALCHKYFLAEKLFDFATVLQLLTFFHSKLVHRSQNLQKVLKYVFRCNSNSSRSSRSHNFLMCAQCIITQNYELLRVANKNGGGEKHRSWLRPTFKCTKTFYLQFLLLVIWLFPDQTLLRSVLFLSRYIYLTFVYFSTSVILA